MTCSYVGGFWLSPWAVVVGSVCHVWVLFMGCGCHLSFTGCFMVVVGIWVPARSLFVAVNGHCGQLLPFTMSVVVCGVGSGKEKSDHTTPPNKDCLLFHYK